MASPAKRFRNGHDDSFISFSDGMDDLCQQLSSLSKECQLRHSEGFGTPSHSRTPERVKLLAETKDILYTMQLKVTELADAHRKAEAVTLGSAVGSPSPSHVTPVHRLLDFHVEKVHGND